MNLLSRTFAISTACALTIGITLGASSVRAQDATAKADPAIGAAAQKIFKAIADDDGDGVKALTAKKYAKKITKEQLRPLQTGPKLTVAYDGTVKVLRSNDKEAVVQTTMFKPDSSEIPVSEASILKIFLVKEKGGWLMSAPDKKEAAEDATMEGGWYHPGSFTFCPNKGLAYEGSHFSNKLNCRSTAICR